MVRLLRHKKYRYFGVNRQSCGHNTLLAIVRYNELVFSVQIGSFKNQSVKELSYGLSGASMVEKDSLVLFVLGEYNSLPDAQQALALVVNLGVENAFIVAQKNGKAVGLLTEQNRE